MTVDVVMPQLGLEVTEATVVEIRVEVGEEVVKDAPMIEMETDKALTEVVAPQAGFVVALEVATGDVVAPGDVVARLGDSPDEAATTSSTPEVAASPRGNPRRVRVAPVARRAAADLGVDLTNLEGSGPSGRITLRDVEAAAAAGAGSSGAGDAAGTAAGTNRSAAALELTGSRRAIARRMTQSQQIPQYVLQRDLDAAHLLAQKDAIAASAGGSGAGVTDLLLQAIAEMVVRHPVLAIVYEDGAEPVLHRHEEIGVGLAVATDRGLVVPVIRDVPGLGLAEIAAHRRELTGAARAGRLSLEQMSGGAITLSNLGGFGVDRFSAMVNPGESAIVAVGRTVDRVVPRGRGIAVIPSLTLTMTFDHRTVDGAVGGAALAALAELLEGGMTWRP